MAGPASPSNTGELLGALMRIARAQGRDDLMSRLDTATSSLAAPPVTVCVVGEFKQGKSTLVNSVLGRDVCPVDDDLATSAITVVRHAERLRIDVWRRLSRGAAPQRDAIAPGAVAEWVTERGNPGNERGVERLEIGLPSTLLATGLVLVDTPGMGSLGAGHAAATLAYLPFAHGLVVVSDALTELNASELAFVREARSLCSNVVLALTKCDIAPEWQKVAALDRAHLRAAGLDDVPLLPVTAPPRALALRDGDASLNERSGYPALLSHLDRVVLAPARQAIEIAALDTAAIVLEQLEQPVATELAASTRPEDLERITVEAERAAARLDHLRGPGSRWSTVLNDRLADLSNEVGFQFRRDIRVVSREVEDAIEHLSTAKDWDAMGRQLQTDVAKAVTGAFQRLEEGGALIRQAIIELLAEESVDLPPLHRDGGAVAVSSLWTSRGVDPNGSRVGRSLSTTLTGMRGAQSGILMFGLLGHYLPAGAAALLMSNPVTIGLGVAFGGMQLFDGHKRRIAQRRQQARANARQFLDDVQFEVGNDVGDAVRTLHRALRDQFGSLLGDLMRTYSETARQAHESAQQLGTQHAERLAMLQAQSDWLRNLRQALDTMGPG